MGSCGSTKFESMPDFVKEKYDSSYDSSGDFRDFATALFGIDLAPENCAKKIIEIIAKYAGVQWDNNKILEMIKSEETTEGKVKKIFYALLSEGGGKMDPNFRYLLKAVITAASHLDNMKAEVLKQFVAIQDKETADRLLSGNLSEDEAKEKKLDILNILAKENLINLDLLGIKGMIESLE